MRFRIKALHKKTGPWFGSFEETSMKTTILACATLLLLGTSSQLFAQQFYAQRAPQNNIPVIQDHSSTVAEGVLRGAADATRAAGDYNYNTSLALINTEVARSLFLDNRLKATQTYFEMRRQNREMRDYNNPRPTQADIVRIAKDRAPDRLTSYQYEPALGKLYWPAIFLDPEFATVRSEIDRLIGERTPENSGLGSPNHRDISKYADRMMLILKSKVEGEDPSGYAIAKTFLTSVEFESQQEMQPVVRVTTER